MEGDAKDVDLLRDLVTGCDQVVAAAAIYYADLIHQRVVGQRLMAEMARDVVVKAIEGH